MTEENLDANIEQESSLVQDEDVSDPSTEETQLEEEVTSQNDTVEKEKPFNEHPRFKELINEKNELKEELRQLRQHVLDNAKPKEAEKDPYEGQTLEERDFWQKVENVAKQVALKQAQAAEAELQAVRNEYGKIAANQFLKEHPDIKAGSEELKKIVLKARQIGGNLEDAYKIEMFDINAQREVEKLKRQKQQKLKEKALANVETKTIPVNAIKSSEEITFNDAFDSAWNNAEKNE